MVDRRGYLSDLGVVVHGRELDHGNGGFPLVGFSRRQVLFQHGWGMGNAPIGHASLLFFTQV